MRSAPQSRFSRAIRWIRSTVAAETLEAGASLLSSSARAVETRRGATGPAYPVAPEQGVPPGVGERGEEYEREAVAWFQNGPPDVRTNDDELLA